LNVIKTIMPSTPVAGIEDGTPLKRSSIACGCHLEIGEPVEARARQRFAVGRRRVAVAESAVDDDLAGLYLPPVLQNALRRCDQRRHAAAEFDRADRRHSVRGQLPVFEQQLSQCCRLILVVHQNMIDLVDPRWRRRRRRGSLFLAFFVAAAMEEHPIHDAAHDQLICRFGRRREEQTRFGVSEVGVVKSRGDHFERVEREYVVGVLV
jgi:hypothetical protein